MIELEGVAKSFGTLQAVRGVSLRVGAGEVFGLLGPNGAGKSTTIGMAVGLIRPDRGTVRLAGAGGPESAAVRRKLGVAPQALALYDELTGRENVQFFGRLQGLTGRALREAADGVLDRVGLLTRAGDRVGGYSGGMKRRLNLAAAIVHDPPIVFLDEPTAGVDPQSRNNILDLVRDLAKAGKAVVYTTHYMEEASRLCTRVGIVDRGEMLALGTVAELLAAHGGESVVTVTRTDGSEDRVRTADPMREAAGLLAKGDAQGVRIDRPDLEGVFLALTGRSLRDA